MQIPEAVQIVSNVCSAYTGNLKDHQNIQTALNVMVAAINSKTEMAKEEIPKAPAKKKK